MPENITHPQDAPALPDRIIFPGSPWPKGHAIVQFRWSARIEPASGLWFDLDLKSANYNADDPVEEDVEEPVSRTNWKSKIVWNNYRNCFLSSRKWNDRGFQVNPDKTPFDFDSLDGREFRVDPLPIDDEDTPAFGIYLQGHDSVADHTISFKKLEAKNTWSIAWRGRVALTYLGHPEFSHQFKVWVTRTSFDGIELPLKTTKEEAELLLRRYATKADQFKLDHVGEHLCFKLA
jgi:hypothetical protein